MEASATTSASIFFSNPQAVIAVLALCLGVVGYRATRDSFRQKNSLEVQKRINESEKVAKWLKDITALNRAIDRKTATPWEQLSVLASHPKSIVTEQDALELGQLDSLTNWLNTLEEIAIGIRHGVYSEQILYDSMKSMVTNTWKITRPYVKARQAERPSRYEFFTWLGVRWMVRESRLTGKRDLQRSDRLAAAYKAVDAALD